MAKAVASSIGRWRVFDAYWGHDGGVAALRGGAAVLSHGRQLSALCGCLDVVLFEDLGEGAGKGLNLARCEAVA